ncbi:MAG: UDP-N-acetylmuramoyl-tripeptide--D-alanyl-D-alanine ligase [Eubacterium sp.]|nr:UDP-N-acetylmuramoyl-tripeptide--D-alanyl-D-alanine ligase [Eubacterium sp.]
MNNITIRDIIRITKGRLLDKVDDDKKDELLSKELKDIVIDSRQAGEDKLFIAIVGENVDAHKFIPDVAADSYAVLLEKDEEEILALSDGKELPRNRAYIKVDSTIDALQDIGTYMRSIYNAKVIGVTGSVGKTTTREMITHALRSSLNVFSTSGNMNSQIGVPLTLSKIMDEPTDIAVIEMGISEPGGMDKLTRMVMPDIAVCTMIGVAHIEFMHTQEGIREEKLKIAGRMGSEGAIFLNSDDELLKVVDKVSDCRIYRYGTGDNADYKAEDIRYENGFNTYTYCHGDERITVNLLQSGKHNVLNSLVAMAICDYLGLDLNKAAASFESFAGLRQKEIQTEKGYHVIDDTYNASPDSMKAALNVLAEKSCSGKKIAVLGDMFELGPNSDEYHKVVGRYINELLDKDENAIDILITVGDSSKLLAAEVNKDIDIRCFDSNDEATEAIKEILGPGDVIILKASNGMKFAGIVKEII